MAGQGAHTFCPWGDKHSFEEGDGGEAWISSWVELSEAVGADPDCSCHWNKSKGLCLHPNRQSNFHGNCIFPGCSESYN